MPTICRNVTWKKNNKPGALVYLVISVIFTPNHPTMKSIRFFFSLIFTLTASLDAISQVQIAVNLKEAGIPMSQDLIGAFFEDINYGADGGLYAELVQNRSFEYYVVNGYNTGGPLTAWYAVQ